MSVTRKHLKFLVLFGCIGSGYYYLSQPSYQSPETVGVLETASLRTLERESLGFIKIFPKFRQLGEDYHFLSAFYDESVHAVRVLGLSVSHIFYPNPEVSCTFLDDANHIIPSSPGKDMVVKFVDTNKDFLQYLPIWVLCPVGVNVNGSLNLIKSVRLTGQVHAVAPGTSSVTVPVEGMPPSFGRKDEIETTTPPTPAMPRYKMGMCISPLFDYEDPLKLVEWIEFHKLLGADHFTFYNYSIGPITSKILRSYDPQSVAVIPWVLPFPHGKVHYYGQIWQLNDCLWRYRGIAEFVGFVDLDEFIVPGPQFVEGFTNYHDYFTRIFNSSRDPREVSGITFAALFAFDHFPERDGVNIFLANCSGVVKREESSKLSRLGNKLQILTRHSLARSGHFSYKRKQVLQPHLVIEMDVHFTTRCSPNTQKINVLEDQVRFLHFRKCSAKYMKDYCSYNCTGMTCENIPYEQELSVVRRFGNDLFVNVYNRNKEFGLEF